MRLGININNHNYDDNDVANDGDGSGAVPGGSVEAFGSVSCTICLEAVIDNGDRSLAKLQCGHQFHLDCIGSAFNAKGAMQCPNCRKIEKGRWLYANSCRSSPEFNMVDWAYDEDLNDLSYSEVLLQSFGVHWCPFGSLMRPPSFEDEEFASSSYHDLLGEPGYFTEPTPTSSAAHPCPYIAYIGPVRPSSSNSNGSMLDSSNFNTHWNGDISAPYGFPTVDPHYHSWEYQPPPFSTLTSRMVSANLQNIPPVAPRSSRTNSDIPRPLMHPFLVGHSSIASSGISVSSASRIPPYQGSNARNRDRVQALQAYYQQAQSQSQSQSHPSDPPAVSGPVIPSIMRRSNRGINTQVGSMASSSDQTTGFTRFTPWERDHHLHQSFSLNQMDGDSRWRIFHQGGHGSS